MNAALPTWDLTDFYANRESPAIKRDLNKVKKRCEAFSADYSKKMKTLSAAKFARAIEEYEAIEELLGKVISYAQLLHAANTEDGEIGRFYQGVQEQVVACSSLLMFFTLSINAWDNKRFKELLKHKGVAHYAPWLRDIRTMKPFQLDEAREQLLQEKDLTGRGAWNRLFDESMARMRFKLGAKELTNVEIFDLMSDPSQKKREAAAHSVAESFADNAPLFTHITNTLAKDKAIEDTVRGFEKPIASRNVANSVEDEVVDALMGTVQVNYKNLSHRYFKWKAKHLGVKKLNYWDRNAPLSTGKGKSYSWDEAKDIVLDSYHNFSPEMAKVGKKFFDKNWIDADVYAGKDSGAFSHPTVPSVHPYILMNFQGKTRDVMTLAHELGHGVHQVLAADQGALMADTPLTLAETASVFGEMLTFQEILRREKNQAKRQLIIAGKIEDMLNTVVRQVAFCEFERQLHDARKKGELSTQEIGAIWMKAQKESLGPAFTLDKEYHVFWMYIPHFIHVPFYVYAYAFGDCLVNSLYAAYEKEVAAGNADKFVKKYHTMLEAGGTLGHKQLLKPFGLDASKPDFWQQGLDVISGYIDMLD